MRILLLEAFWRENTTMEPQKNAPFTPAEQTHTSTKSLRPKHVSDSCPRSAGSMLPNSCFALRIVPVL
ncbi:hypothetical protein B0T26DRAFT_478111 [Lasiosphaeria miniovina]|uniref:Uncharacterized protein n=1 Tax=Lasiosphaeria miniovina TaxID=1954250 RepID=A0AA40A076_9PEZI|nr:uncharacterized protein B0T26DRAFT_478111 [Lasiosphaeria miniovina]KAK0706872.1 hypothetical protein B0T26DRAFT_478111 [Lasiosphaeria miniovina]